VRDPNGILKIVLESSLFKESSGMLKSDFGGVSRNKLIMENFGIKEICE
jgi:hypothetical protein